MAVTPAAASGAEEVPPGNSAVNQYTEAFPTAEGDKDANERDRGKRTPKNVLGERNTEKLGEEGPDGRAVAELSAETAPSGGEEVVEETEQGLAPSSGGGGGEGGGGDVEPAGEAGGPTGGDERIAAGAPLPEAEGSSGIGEVIATATGTSSGGGLGVVLLLLLLATLIWAAAYVGAQRRPAR